MYQHDASTWHVSHHHHHLQLCHQHFRHLFWHLLLRLDHVRWHFVLLDHNHQLPMMCPSSSDLKEKKNQTNKCSFCSSCFLRLEFCYVSFVKSSRRIKKHSRWLHPILIQLLIECSKSYSMTKSFVENWMLKLKNIVSNYHFRVQMYFYQYVIGRVVRSAVADSSSIVSSTTNEVIWVYLFLFSIHHLLWWRLEYQRCYRSSHSNFVITSARSVKAYKT